MNKIQLFSTVALAALLSACANDDERFYPQGEGRLIICPEIKSDISVVTRAAADEDQLNQSLILWLSNSKGVIRKYHGLDEVPDNEWLKAGDYLAEAWAGDSVPASFTDRWFKGSQSFSIRAGEATQVTIPCYIANVLVEIAYDPEVEEGLVDPVFTVGHVNQSLTYDKSTPSLGYFMMPSVDKNLTWTLEAKAPNGTKIHKEGIIENAQPATKYILKVKAGSADEPVGGTFFDVYVDLDAEILTPEVIIKLAPVIDGFDFDANHQDVFTQGEVGDRSMFISASAPLAKATLSVDAEVNGVMKNLSQLLDDMKDGDGNVLKELDFMRASDELLNKVGSYGIHGYFDPIEGSIESSLTIVFSHIFTNSLPAGNYHFNYYAEDSEGRSSTLSRSLRITDAALAINNPKDYDVWATKATVSAEILQADYGNALFQYRLQGSSTWTDVTPSVKDKLLTAEITGLTPATTYEYRIVSDKDNFESEQKSFTTESALQLPNAGFEDWNTTSTPYLLFAEGGQMFWDSGNHGSATLNKNITVPDANIKKSGNYAVKLASQKVVIKFAAGNAFIGKYLATEGTDGVLGWGRPFASRPKALRGYVKYSPVAVTDVSGGDLSKGDMDNGIIYIAILDNTTKEYGGEHWPVIIKTKSSERSLFSKDDPNVIAYGEKTFDSATSGDDLIEFEIPLEYFKTNVKGANIMVTMSASKYGDYFTGGNGSTMWIDDLELVY